MSEFNLWDYVEVSEDNGWFDPSDGPFVVAPRYSGLDMFEDDYFVSVAQASNPRRALWIDKRYVKKSHPIWCKEE